MDEIEIRCPVGPRRLLFKMYQEGHRPHVVPGNLIEVACDDCKRTMRRRDPSVVRVVHRFNLAGELIESKVIRD
jgi:hypothetical protein